MLNVGHKELILQQKINRVGKPKKEKKEKEIVTWPMMWLNRSITTIIATFQLLDI